MVAKYLLKCAIFVILCASFMFGGSAYPRGQDLSVRYLIEKGIDLYEQGLLDDAIKEFNKALSVDPDNFIAKEYLTTIRYDLEMNNLKLARGSREAKPPMLSEQPVRETGFDQTIGDLSAQAMSLNERNKELELKLRTLSLDITMLKKALTNRDQQLAAVSGQLSSSQSDKAREVGSIEERFLKAQSDKDQEIANIEERFLKAQSDKDQEIADIREKLSKLQKEYDKVSKEYSRSSLKKELGQGQDDMIGCKEIIMARGDEIQELEFKLADLQNEYERKLSGSAAKMEKLKEALEAKDAEIKRIKRTR